MSLNLLLNDLIALKQKRDEARERWTALLSKADEGHFAARREHLSLDDAYEGKVAELISTVSTLNQDDVLEDELVGLPFENKRVLEHLLSERGMIQLIDEGGSREKDLTVLVTKWRRASTNLDAAQRLNFIRQQAGADLFADAIDEETESFRVPEAFAQAVSALRQILGVDIEDLDADADDKLADAIWQMIRNRRSRLDKAAEKLQTVLQDLFDSGTLDYALSELDFDLARAVRDAIAGGFILQRQLQPQAKPQARPVTVLERTEIEPGEEQGE